MAVISVAPISIANWELGSDVQLRIYALSSFLAADNSIVSAGVPSEDSTVAGTFFQPVACTVNGTTLSIAAFTLESTTDSLDNPAAQYGAYFYTTEGQRIAAFAEFAAFSLPNLPSSTTWTAIATAQKGNL